jgi:hypothetical protein
MEESRVMDFDLRMVDGEEDDWAVSREDGCGSGEQRVRAVRMGAAVDVIVLERWEGEESIRRRADCMMLAKVGRGRHRTMEVKDEDTVDGKALFGFDRRRQG